MSDGTSTPSGKAVTWTYSTTNPSGDGSPFDISAAFWALGDSTWMQMVMILGEGKMFSATHMAARLGRDFDGVRKHLNVLRKAGVVSFRWGNSEKGEDGRHGWYYLSPKTRATPGVLDFGFCQMPVPLGLSTGGKD